MGTLRRTRGRAADEARRLRIAFHEPGWTSATLTLRSVAGRTLRLFVPGSDPSRPPRRRVIFVSEDNAGRSQMAAAFFNELADPARARAISVGSRILQDVDPAVARAMAEVGVPLRTGILWRLSASLAASAGDVVTLGCPEDCAFLPGVRLQDWPVENPRGKPVETIRAIRDEIRRRVGEMIEANGWARSRTGG